MNLYKHPKLREAFEIFVQEQNALLPDEAIWATIVPSAEFEARMQKMIRRQKCGYYVLFGTMARRVATVVIALFLGATIVTFSVEALRQPVVRFFTQVFETFTRVVFVDDTSEPLQEDVEMEKKAPSYIPDGYVVESEEEIGTIYRTIYVNTKTGEQIFIRQQLIDTYSSIVDTENVDYQDIMVAHTNGIVYQNKGTTTIVFIDGNCSFFVYGNATQTELLKVAESIIK